MTCWWQKFNKENIFFVSPDVKRAMGVEDLLPNCHIICSYFDPLIPILRRQGANIFCLEEKIVQEASGFSNSGKLLENKLVLDYITNHSAAIPWIAYFKPSVKLDFLIKKRGFLPIGNSVDLNEKFENKIRFYDLVNEYFPKYSIQAVIGVLKNLSFKSLAKKLDLPLVVQFGHGWAGKTTFFINAEKEFENLVQKYTYTKVKVSRKIKGFTVLNNCCLYRKSVLISPPAIQISDIPKLHPKPGVTCGRQWPIKSLTRVQVETIKDLSKKIGKMMSKTGFKGFFGLDFIISEKTGKIYLSEANARLTASAPFYTRLERGLSMIPLFAYHLASFLDTSLEVTHGINDEITGSQITLRLPEYKSLISKMPEFGVFRWQNDQSKLLRREYLPEKLNSGEFIFISRLFKSKKPSDEELARIETKDEVIEAPGKLKSWLMQLIDTECT